MAIIEVEHVTKEFHLGQVQSLKTMALNQFRRMTGSPTEKSALFKALEDVSFRIDSGEVVGIIGHNGAGKSTLLKLLANISKATTGSISVKGKVAPLIEVGAGLVPDLTGRENIYLNGSILGIPKSVIARKFDDIVAFAEIEQFVDTPIKRYSSGMQVRIGFAIATSIDSDILIVDEVLAVGDLAFQRKCFERMESLIKDEGRTVLIVSHNIRQVERLCGRVILLDHGRAIRDGDPREVCDTFYAQSDEKIRISLAHSARNTVMSNEMELLDITFRDSMGRLIPKLLYRSNVEVCFRVKVLRSLEYVTLGFGFHTTDFLYLTTHNSEDQLHIPRLEPGEHEFRCKIERFPLLPGVYSLRFVFNSGRSFRTVFYGENLVHFQVLQAAPGDVPISFREGFFALDAHWHFAGQDAADLAVSDAHGADRSG